MIKITKIKTTIALLLLIGLASTSSLQATSTGKEHENETNKNHLQSGGDDDNRINNKNDEEQSKKDHDSSGERKRNSENYEQQDFKTLLDKLTFDFKDEIQVDADREFTLQDDNTFCKKCIRKMIGEIHKATALFPCHSSFLEHTFRLIRGAVNVGSFSLTHKHVYPLVGRFVNYWIPVGHSTSHNPMEYMMIANNMKGNNALTHFITFMATIPLYYAANEIIGRWMYHWTKDSFKRSKLKESFVNFHPNHQNINE